MCLASFTQYNVLKVYQCCSMSQYFIPFFWPNNIPSLDIPHFAYPSVVDEPLSWFHLLAIMNSECCYEYLCTNFCLNIYFKSLGSMPRSGVAGSYGNSMINLFRNYQTIFTMAVPLYVPNSNVLEIHYLCFLCNT